MSSDARAVRPDRLARLLWVDCTAGALVGLLVLAFGAGLSRLHRLPYEVLLVLGVANLLYAAYSFSLARRADRSVLQVQILVGVNAAWAVVCAGIVVRFWDSISGFGIAHLVGEALFVAGLARLEWRYRGARR